ncbi:MAG: carbon storage regulator [Proteobacteria bacterium]|nr:carbon storage regulator [Pseudomonadota bacterium]
MLVISRNHQESLTITTPTGEQITIRILDASRDSAMLGIEAPSDFMVSREDSVARETWKSLSRHTG